MVLSCHYGEDFPLNRGGAIFNAVNHIQTEQVESSVDLIADESRWLLNESLDLAILPSDNDTVACGVLDFGHHNGALLAVTLVESDELI